MRKSLTTAVFLCFTYVIFGQKPTAIFNRHRDSLPTQQIYIHFDRQAYVAGDTAWFKAYLYSNYAPSELSTNFYIDLVDKTGAVLQAQRYPVIDGTAMGNFYFPQEMKQAVYVVRAYTSWTKNLDASFVFKKAIPVFNPALPSSASATGNLQFEFFPESGKIVSGLTNNIAFRALDGKLRPVQVTADLVDSKGNKIGNFAKAQSEGVFSFVPVANEKYFASVTTGGGPDALKVELPQAETKGAVMILADEEEGKSFSVLFSPGLIKDGEQLDLLGVVNHHVVVETKVPVTRSEASGTIPVKNIPPGMLHLLLFDGSGNLLAQRTTLVQKEDIILPVEIKINDAGKLVSEKNTFTLTFPDYVTGSFSVSVTDADKELHEPGPDDILSSLLVQNGSYKYISNPRPATESETDVLTISNKWYGSDLSSLSKKPIPGATNDNYISIKGKVVSKDGSPVTAEGNINLTVQPKNLMQKSYSAILMPDGSFSVPGIVFEDSAKFFYDIPAARKNKKPAGAALELTETKEDFLKFLKGIDYRFAVAKEALFTNATHRQLAAELQKSLGDQLKDLPEVLKVSKTKKESVNNRYTSGLFKSSPAKAYDFVNNPPSVRGGTNVFDYMQGQIGGLTIEKAGSGYNIWSNRAQSLFMGNRNSLIAGKVFLDEVESSSQIIMRIPIDQIALVKYFEPGSIMLPGVGAGPVLAVWTKKPEDMVNNKPLDLDFVWFTGYQSTKDFTPVSEYGPRNKATLSWNPEVIVNNEQQISFNFFKPANVKKVRVVVEGFTTSGRLLHIDRVIEQ